MILNKMNEQFAKQSKKLDKNQSRMNQLSCKLDKEIEDLRSDLRHMSNACMALNEHVRKKCKTYTDNQITNYQRKNKNDMSQLIYVVY